MQFGDEPLSGQRIRSAVDAARDCGFAAVSANDHLVFQTPWLDGPAALASVIDRSGAMELATTVVLSDGRLIAGVGPGSSAADYAAAGIPFEERWKRFENAVAVLRALLRGEAAAGVQLAPAPVQSGGVPVWIGSWGSDAGLARVARLGDGWLASAYNTTPARFAAGRAALPDGFPNALATMWTWVAKDRTEGERVLAEVLAPVLAREPDELGAQVCVGTPEHCAEVLRRYAGAGCDRVYLWPLGEERRQLELVASAVAPLIGP